MKAVRGHEGAPNLIEVNEAPGQGETFTMTAAGIWGSDLNYPRMGTERILGHELAGVRSYGTPVSVEGLFGCGQCEYCLQGRSNLYSQSPTKALEIMQVGGMVEQFRVLAHKLLPLPEGLAVVERG